METYTPAAGPRRPAAGTPMAMASRARRRGPGGLPLQSWMLLIGLVVVTLAVVGAAVAVVAPTLNPKSTTTPSAILTQTISTPIATLTQIPTEQSIIPTVSLPTAYSSNASGTLNVKPTGTITQSGNQGASSANPKDICVFKVDSASGFGTLSSIANNVFSKKVSDIKSFYTSCEPVANSSTDVKCKDLRNYLTDDEKGIVHDGEWIVIPVSSSSCTTSNPPGRIFNP
jgi:hypothetical protein